MSMCICSKCDAAVDSDIDPDCFVEKPNYTNTAQPANPQAKEKIEYITVCETCREEEGEEDDANN